MKYCYSSRSSRSIATTCGNRAFTQLEMIVGMGVIATLIAVCVGICGSAMTKASMIREISAGKTLITAYTLYAGENNGNYLRGYDPKVSVFWYPPTKQNVTGVFGSRYPYRLSQYFNYQINGVILFNKHKEKILSNYEVNSFMYNYMVTLCPGFGINYQFVGGYWPQATELRFASECKTTQGASTHSLLVFASSAYTDPSQTERYEGHHLIGAPQGMSEIAVEATPWTTAKWTKGANPRNYGYLDGRYDGKAVCVFLDGSIRTHTVEELRDMRLWSDNAYAQNNPDYVPQP